MHGLRKLAVASRFTWVRIGCNGHLPLHSVDVRHANVRSRGYLSSSSTIKMPTPPPPPHAPHLGQPLVVAWTPVQSRLSATHTAERGSAVHVKLNSSTNGAAVVLDSSVEMPKKWKGQAHRVHTATARSSGAVYHNPFVLHTPFHAHRAMAMPGFRRIRPSMN